MHQLVFFVWYLRLPLVLNAGAPWTGNMHPRLGFPDGCDITKTGDCTRSYEELEQNGALWACPSGARNPGSCSFNGCVNGQGDYNPLCPNLGSSSPCCCPRDGCWAKPEFNWIIGVCKSTSCACGGSNSMAHSCGDGKTCGGSCGGQQVPCCFGADVSRLVPYYNMGSNVVLNYIAAYQYDIGSRMWIINQNSSFNTDGRYPAYDLMQQYGGIGIDNAWLAPQPGGAVFWGVGYYPAGVKGVGPPGTMFVMSAEEWWGATWYVLNQMSMDRGPGYPRPAKGCPITNDNCWAAGNSGEMDFLEPAWNRADAGDDGYLKSFSSSNNQAGRCFIEGVNSGGFSSKNYLKTEPRTGGVPIIYVAIMDSVGNWLYRIPADRAESIWPGISRKTIEAKLQATPSMPPNSVNPCTEEYCLVFTAQCQATTWDDAHKQGCGFNGQQGFCGNWAQKMTNTNQPLVPNDHCQRDVRGGVTMPWCEQMVPRSSLNSTIL